MQLSKLRQKCGLTQAQLAKKVGVSRGLIAMVETGTIRAYPSLRRRIAEALGVSEEKVSFR